MPPIEVVFLFRMHGSFMRKILIAGLLILLGSSSTAVAADSTQEDDLRRQIIVLNKKYAQLMNTLNELLQKDIKSSVNTTLNISLVKPINNFKLISIEIFDNDQLIANHIYSPIEIEALEAGGRQLLHKGELRSGDHNLKISYVLASGEGSPKKNTLPLPLSAHIGNNYHIELSFKKNKSDILMQYSQLAFDGQK